MATRKATSPKNAGRRTIIVGGQWGDEGKGKLVDKMAKNADAVVRYSGANNAGHTIEGPKGKFVGHYLPSGIVQGKTCILTRGVLMNLGALLDEVEQARKTLGDLPRIYIDGGSPLWTPWHSQLEAWLEHARKINSDSTKKGVAPMQGLYDLRVSLRVGDIFLPARELIDKLGELFDTMAPLLHTAEQQNLLQTPILNPVQVANDLLVFRDRERGVGVGDTRELLLSMIAEGRNLLFEGAQAALLDQDWGTYPYISSGKSTSLGIPQCTGIPLSKLEGTKVIVVVKLFPTRVGNGWMGSEIHTRDGARRFAEQQPKIFDTASPARTLALARVLKKINRDSATSEEYSQYIQALGFEVGATTGRGRSPGHPDPFLARYAAELNGASCLGLMRLDMGSGLKKIPMVTGYYKRSSSWLPWEQEEFSLNRCSEFLPTIEEFPGWEQDISGCKEWRRLPEAARKWVLRFQEIAGTKVKYIGTGPHRDALIVR